MAEVKWDEFKVRCSAIGDVMSNSRDNPILTDNQVEKLAEYRKRMDGVGKPLTELQKVEMVALVDKDGNGKKVILSDTCIDYLMIEYAWLTERMIPTGKESLDLVAIKKGNMVQYDSMVLLTRLDKLPYKEHKDRIYSDYLSGQVDIYLGEHIMSAAHIADLKNSWDYPVFLQKINKKIDPHHDLQVKGYMSITGAGTGEITHTLVNTPDVIIEDMKWRVAKKMNALTIESPEFIEEWIKWEHSMRFDHMPLHKRVWRHKVDRWSKPEEEKVHDKVKICRQWLADFHERRQKNEFTMKVELDNINGSQEGQEEQLPPLKAGDYVHYIPEHGEKENGRIKSIGSDGRASVVYKCAGEWDKYQEYTGQVTELTRLSRGWIDGDEPKQTT